MQDGSILWTKLYKFKSPCRGFILRRWAWWSLPSSCLRCAPGLIRSRITRGWDITWGNCLRSSSEKKKGFEIPDKLNILKKEKKKPCESEKVNSASKSKKWDLQKSVIHKQQRCPAESEKQMHSEQGESAVVSRKWFFEGAPWADVYAQSTLKWSLPGKGLASGQKWSSSSWYNEFDQRIVSNHAA